MKSGAEKAAQTFSKGYNCVKSALSTFAAKPGIKEENALKTSSGFGSGMARLQEVCGAVSGAYTTVENEAYPPDLLNRKHE